MSFYNGVHYFITISLDVDYLIDETMEAHLLKHFPESLFVTEEKGKSGKHHLHAIGLSTARQDNIRKGIVRVLEKLQYSISPHSVDVRPEPNVRWRAGYIQKENDHKRIINVGFAEEMLKHCLEEYTKKPKREREEIQGKRLSLDTLVQECIDAHCTTEREIQEFLRLMKRSGKLPFSSYQKINRKKLVSYVTDSFDD